MSNTAGWVTPYRGSTLALAYAVKRRLFCGCLLVGALVRAQAPATWTIAEEERFLMSATVENEVPAGKGLTKSQKAILTDGRRTHAAHIQTIDIYQPLFKGKDGTEEREFKDSWKFNVAAYRLAKLLHLTDMVPVSVARPMDGKPASLDWWVDGVLMDEKERVEGRISPPDVPRWNRQMDTIRIFDQLIYNMDRSQENLLITKDWRVWMIDHSRAFRKWTTLRDPSAVKRCDPELQRAIQHLRREDVARELGPFLTGEEIDGLMARRTLILNKLAGNS